MTRAFDMHSARTAIACACLTLGLAACGGVEFQGKIFEMAGLSGGSGSRDEPQLATRAPLVPPPRTDVLPEPGAVPAQQQHMAWPNDPDRRRAAARQSQDEALKEYCARAETSIKPLGNDLDGDPRCRKSILSGIGNGGGLTGMFKKSKDGAAATTNTEDEPLLPPESAPRQ